MLDLGQGGMRRLRNALVATTMLASGLTAPTFAQVDAQQVPPPTVVSTDANGVDLLRGTLALSRSIASVGGSAGGMSYVRNFTGDGWRDNYMVAVNQSGTDVFVTFGGSSDQFTVSGTNYAPSEGQGSTLVTGPGAGQLKFTAADGTVVIFGDVGAGPGYQANLGRAITATSPDGEVQTFTYKTLSVTECINDTCTRKKTATKTRLQSVLNTRGYQVHFDYQADTATTIPDLTQLWMKIAKVTTFNMAVDYCAPNANSCTFSQSWPNVSYAIAAATASTNTITETDAMGRATRYTLDAAIPFHIYGIKRPSSSTDNMTIAYDASGKVQSVLTNDQTYTYGYVDASNIRTTTVNDPLSGQRVLTSDLTIQRVLTDRDALLRTTTYGYDANRRLNLITMPEGNKIQYTYDTRGNPMQTRAISKTPGTPPDIVTSASYPASCVTTTTCNKPTSTTDAKGNVTDYTYDAIHGGLLTVTAPASASGGIRPQTRLTYVAKQAFYKNTGGSVVASGQTQYVLTASSTCQTAAACTGVSDETKTTIDYGPQVAGTANNLLPVTASKGSGDGALTAMSAVSYDSIGNTVLVDGPLPGTADTTRTIYDAARQVVGVIGPDPDGAGAMKNRAARVIYNLDGQVTLAEQGTTTGQSDANWTAFASLQQAATTYDANARPVKQELNAGGTTYAFSQTSYDALGRIDCSALRMGPTVWASQSNICLPQTAGANGPDRITRQVYDAASQMTKVQTAVGTADASDEVTSSYNLNGTTATLADANGNLTTNEYDGFDRLLKTRYPIAGNGTVSSTTDYDGVNSYDANGNVLQRRLRDGQLINYSYDNLNRMTLKDVPNIVYGEPDVGYSYDLLGRMLAATNNNGFRSVTRTYDALSRMVSENAQLSGTFTMVYDLAGRLTRLTHPDGLYIDYNHLVTGEVSAIRENGATSGAGVLGSYAYNDLGQLVTLTRGNGTVTNYSFDPVALLTGLTHDLGGTAQDVSTTFTYNPASQIASTTRSNDIYAWNGHYNIDRPYTVNGLNQLVTAGATALGYDGRGNLTTSGTNAYSYTSENRLVNGPAGAVLVFDALGRLATTALSGGSVDQQTFDNVGGNIVIERGPNGVGLLRRYVYGPGIDTPLVWYEGSGTTDRRWLHADERGSIVAVTNAQGQAIAVNSYDDYGIPASTNLGRFQYTGQAWLPELGMYYYKARIYSATLGRFMQSDPIGYGDGMNMYGYVGSDPVNFSDPSGDRGLTNGEKAILAGIFGQYLDVNKINIFENPFSDRGAVIPYSILIGAGYSDDFSQLPSNSTARNTFLHESYHTFEKQLNIASQSFLIINQAAFGFGSNAYKWVNSNGQDVNYQNPEVRADTFANCQSGNSASCKLFDDFSKTIPYKAGQLTITFNNNRFSYSYTYTTTGSRIPVTARGGVAAGAPAANRIPGGKIKKH